MVHHGHSRKINLYNISIMFTLLLIGIIPLCHSVRLEYRPSLGEIFTYSEVEVTEVINVDEDIEYSTERKETIYTEKIVEIDDSDTGMTTVEINYISVNMTPPNERKKDLLVGLRSRVKVNRQGAIQTALTSLVTGDAKNLFPLYDIDVGQSWTITANGLGKGNTRYTLVSIDQNQAATLEMESRINVFGDLGTVIISGMWKIDLATGVTLKQELTVIKQVFSRRTVKKTIQNLIARE